MKFLVAEAAAPAAAGSLKVPVPSELKSMTAPDAILKVAPEPMVITAVVLVEVVRAENARLGDPEHDPQVQLPRPEAVEIKHWLAPVGPGMPAAPPPPDPPCWANIGRADTASAATAVKIQIRIFEIIEPPQSQSIFRLTLYESPV